MSYLDNIVFAIILGLGFGYFYLNIKKLVRNINLGIAVDRNDNPKARWSNMAMIALGQSKMVKRPVAGFFHIIVYYSSYFVFLVSRFVCDVIYNIHQYHLVMLISFDHQQLFHELYRATSCDLDKFYLGNRDS